MATEPIIDFAQLLAPISDEQPTGSDFHVNVSYDSPLQRCADKYDECNSRERKLRSFPFDPSGEAAIPEGELTPDRPEWDLLVEYATDALQNHTKDLWIASYLVQGLCRTAGLTGIRDGFRLVRELAEQYWDNIYPRPDEYDREDFGLHTAVTRINSLNDSFSDDIDRIEIVSRTSGRGITVADYRDATSAKVSHPWITRDEIEGIANALDSSHFTSLLEDSETALAEFEQMIHVLEDKCKQEDFSGGLASSNIKESLQECSTRLKYFIGEEEIVSAEGADDAGDTAGPPVGGGGGGISGTIQNRQDAFNTIRRVAEFFEKTEPHSPMSYLLRESLNWRTMTFPQLMKRLLEDESARDSLFKRTGVQEEEEEQIE
jgi:type VI secretion system protein ImpA